MQGRPQVLVLQVDIQASLNQKFRCKHIVMASTLQKARTVDFLIITLHKMFTEEAELVYYKQYTSGLVHNNVL